MSTNSKVWLITGCSSGLGAAFAKSALKAGHRVVATARKSASLSYLPDSPSVLKLDLDVTVPAAVDVAFDKAIEAFGRVDVVVNNAGYSLFGEFEGMTDEQSRRQMETNFWGPVHVTKRALQTFREVNPKGEGGLIVQVSSIGGYAGFPGEAFYHASKFALEGLTECLQKEVLPEWNIKFLILEPGGVRTEFIGPSMVQAEPHPAYTDPSAPVNKFRAFLTSPKAHAHFADPNVVADILVRVVDGDNIPLRLPMGTDSWSMVKADTEQVMQSLEEWKDVSQACSGKAQLDSLNFLRK